jgi:hypothetical protein
MVDTSPDDIDDSITVHMDVTHFHWREHHVLILKSSDHSCVSTDGNGYPIPDNPMGTRTKWGGFG